jgi:hypothetical protein
MICSHVECCPSPSVTSPRELRPHIWEFLQPADSLCPEVDFTEHDRRLGHVVENEPLAREPLYKLSSDRKVARIDRDVIGQIEFFEPGNARQEFRLQQETLIELRLHDVGGCRPALGFSRTLPGVTEHLTIANQPIRRRLESAENVLPIRGANVFVPGSGVLERRLSLANRNSQVRA